MMINQRISFAFLSSILLHGAIVYCCLLASSLSAKIYVPINSPIMTMEVAQVIIEKKMNSVEVASSQAGGLVSSPDEVESATIIVDKEYSPNHSEERSTKSIKPQETPKKTPPKQPIKEKTAKHEKEQVSHRNDDDIQDSKEGESDVQTAATGVQGFQQTNAIGESTDSQNHDYLSKIVQEIERHKQFPRRARTMNIEGQVRVSFQITDNGQLINATVEPTKNSGIFEKAVLDAIKRSKPVGPRPTNVKEIQTTTIVFKLTGG